MLSKEKVKCFDSPSDLKREGWGRVQACPSTMWQKERKRPQPGPIPEGEDMSNGPWNEFGLGKLGVGVNIIDCNAVDRHRGGPIE